MKKLFRKLFPPPFRVVPCATYAKWDVEGPVVILYRRSIHHRAPNWMGLIGFSAGVKLKLRKGWCAVFQPDPKLARHGLIPSSTPVIIHPGDTRELCFDFYLSDKPNHLDDPHYYEPLKVGDVLGSVTVIKTV